MNLIDVNSTLPASGYSFLNALAKKGRRPATIKRYLYDLEDFFRWVHDRKGTPYEFSAILESDLEDYFYMLESERQYQLRTLKRVETVLKQFFRYLIAEQAISHSPVPTLSSKENVRNKITANHFLSEKEQNRLLSTIQSLDGLSNKQMKARPLLMKRNLAIVSLILHYGLSLREVAQLTMKDLSFGQSTLHVHSDSSLTRTITLTQEDKVLCFEYLHTIPVPVRPRLHTDDPFFIAFDFHRNTYRWVYELDQPKALTEIAIQKMIRLEVRRAGLRKGISAQHLRHTYAVNALKDNVPHEQILMNLGMKTAIGLNKYLEYLAESKED